MDLDVVWILPPEILEKIFSSLPINDLIACSRVCVIWYQVVNSTRLWRKFLDLKNGDVVDSEPRDCDAVTSNFPNTMCSLKTIMPSTLSPLDQIKIVLKQRNFLRYNWGHGVYSLHCFEPKHCRFEKFRLDDVTVSYPSKAPQDCLYYPILGTRKSGKVGFYLIRLDDRPRIVYTLIRNVKIERRFDSVRLYMACVMRDYVVWVVENTIQCFALTCDSNDSKVQTLGKLNCIEYEIHITMDVDHILASSMKSCYVWCKRTLDLKFRHDMSDDIILDGVCLNDGCLVMACTTIRESSSRKSIIEVYNLERESMFQNRFVLDGICIGLKCSKTCIAVRYRSPSADSDYRYVLDNFQIRDKITSRIKFSHTSTYGRSGCIFKVIGDHLFTYNPDSKTSTVWNLSTGQCVHKDLSANVYHGQFLFDNILVNGGNGSIEVWDWTRNVKLYSLHTVSGRSTRQPSNGIWTRFMRKIRTDPISRLPLWMKVPPDMDSVIHVSEARIITLNRAGIFKVYGFG